MSFKIADGFVSVTPDDDGFEAKLRAQIAAATDGLKAVVGLEVRPDMADAAEATLGEAIGAKLADSIGETVHEELPANLAPSFKDAGVLGGDIFTKAFGDETVRGFGDQGVFGGSLGASLGTGLGDEGKKSGEEFTAKFSESAKDAMMRSTIAEMLAPDSPVGESIVDQGDETGKKAGKKIGESASEGMSPLLLGAFATAAALGPAAILAGMSVAVVGLGALVVKSNADIEATYQHLATDVGDTLKTATAPLVPAVEASLVEVDSAVKTVAPTLKSLFTDAEPDMFVFTQGVTGLAEQFLPRFTQAVDESRGIVADFSQGLPALGAGAGNFFDGLTTDSQATGRGFQDFEKLTGTALGTTGQVIGSFSAAASTALDAVVPAADGALTVIQKLANPATIGGLAGGLAVKQWGSGIQSGLQSASNGFLNVAAKAEGADGLIGKAGSAAESASGGFGTMADMMGGPWGVAVGAGVGLLGGLVAEMRQGVASASDFTAAVAQDSGQVGANTETIIQQTIAKANLSDLNSQLGVSTATLIAYASGDKAAQEQVTAAYTAKMQAEQAEGAEKQKSTQITKDGQQAQASETETLYAAKQRLDEVTSAVAQAIAQQNAQTASLQAAEKATNIFTQQVNTAKLALQQQAQTALINATALNETLPVQGQLSQAAIKGALAMQQETTATSGYTSSLTALYGQYGDTSQAQASFTTQLVGLKGQITSGTNAVNLNSKAGSANYTAFEGAATAAQNYAEKLYQQTGSASQADAALQHAVTQIDSAARSAGLSAAQVQKLNVQLFGVKSPGDIKIGVDDSSAVSTLNTLQNQINHIRSTGVSVAPQEAHRASGGPVTAGQAYVVGEQRQEMFVAPTDGYIYPSVGAGQQAVAQHNTQVAKSGAAAAPAMAGGTTVHQYFSGSSLPSIEQRATMRRELAFSVGVG